MPQTPSFDDLNQIGYEETQLTQTDVYVYPLISGIDELDFDKVRVYGRIKNTGVFIQFIVTDEYSLSNAGETTSITFVDGEFNEFGININDYESFTVKELADEPEEVVDYTTIKSLKIEQLKLDQKNSVDNLKFLYSVLSSRVLKFPTSGITSKEVIVPAPLHDTFFVYDEVEGWVLKTFDNLEDNFTELIAKLEQDLTDYVEEINKPELDNYVETVSKPSIDDYVEETLNEQTLYFIQGSATQYTGSNPIGIADVEDQYGLPQTEIINGIEPLTSRPNNDVEGTTFVSIEAFETTINGVLFDVEIGDFISWFGGNWFLKKNTTEDRTFNFNTTESMVENLYLVNGDKIRLWGFNNLFDESSHKRIKSSVDDGSGIPLDSGGFAILDEEDEFNVKWFGAIGDDVDDSVAVKKCFDYVKTLNGGKIYFPRGVFVCSNLDIFSNLEVTGIRGSSIVKQKNTGVTTDILFYGLANSELTSDRIKNVKFTGLTIKGTVDVDGFSQFVHLWLIQGGENVIIDNCDFIGFRGDAIGVRSTTVVKAHNKHVVIKNCLFDGVNKDNRNAISVIDAEELLITNNTFVNITRPDMVGAIDFEPNPAYDWITLRHIEVSNNNFRQIGGNVAAIATYFTVAQHELTRPIKFFNIFDNYFEDCNNVLRVSQEVGRVLTDTDESIELSFRNNYIKNCVRSFWLYGVKGIDIKDNVFDSLDEGSRIGWTRDSFQNCIEINIEDNLFKRNGFNDGLVISLYDVSKINIKENIFQDCGDLTLSYGVIAKFNTSASLIAFNNNTITNALGRTTGVIENDGFINPVGNSYRFNASDVIFDISQFPHDISDFYLTSQDKSAFNSPDDFKEGITMFKVVNTSNLPVGVTDGVIKTEKIGTARKYTTQHLIPPYADGDLNEDIYYRKSNELINTWSAWFKMQKI